MNTSRMGRNGNGNCTGKDHRRFRLGHRWIGATLAVFVLFLAVTGVALNHSHDLGLDRKYVGWAWLLRVYGLDKPEPYAGMIRLGEFVLVGDGGYAHLLLDTGELVESIDLGTMLQGGVERVGHADGRAVLQSREVLYRSDPEVTTFEPWIGGKASEVEWSAAVDADTAGLEALQTAWRGRGVTVERIVLDLHTGRIVSMAGRIVMDAVALGLIVLSLSGLIMARRRRRKRQESRSPARQP